ncbi:MAG: metallophosphoesterase [Chlorobiota bacterium]
MPDGTTAFVCAAAGLLGLIALQLPGWLWLWRQQASSTWRGLIALVLSMAHAPFFYWLLLYKEMPLELPTAVWYVAWFFGLAVVLSGLGLTVWRAVARREVAAGDPASVPVSSQRRSFLRFAVLSGISIVGSAQLLATTRPRRGHVEFVELSVSGLPPELAGLRIGVVSDIHSGPFMQRSQMERYRRELEELECDVVILPGDFIINRTAEIYPFAEAFAGLSAPLGVYAVTGNHDYFSGEVERICREIEQAGIRLLRNEAVVLERNGGRLTLAGLDDFYARLLPAYAEGTADPDGVLSRWESLLQDLPQPRIVACHRPYYFEHLVLLGADAVLSGHTHGGQIVLAELGSLKFAPAAIVSPYLAGTYWSMHRPQAWMYVTRGIGTVGIPVRWNAPPEITHLRLVPAEEA